MTVRTLQDQVSSLITRRVAEAKIAGVSSIDAEARAVLESIALNLLLKPKAVYHLADMARNALVARIGSEIAAIDALLRTVEDLGNVSFSTSDSTHLERAKNALLKMESLDKVDTSGNDFKRFSKSIDDYLETVLSKNVRKKGSADLRRSSSEAASDLPSEFQTLVALHEDVRARLLAFSVGIENFLASPLSTILGLTTVYRARKDLEDILTIVANGESDSQARDLTVRLIGNRAAIRTTGDLPVLDAPLVSTGSVPSGSDIQARSSEVPAQVVSADGPFVFSSSASASALVNGVPTVLSNFPQTGTDLHNRPFIVSGVPSFPVNIPNTYFLFIQLSRSTMSAGYVAQADGTFTKQFRVPFTVGSIGLSQVLTDINAALGSDGEAREYLQAGTSRIILIGASGTTAITVLPVLVESGTAYTNSAHFFLAFTFGQVGVGGTTPSDIIVESINLRIPTLQASLLPSGAIQISSVPTSLGTSMSLVFDASLGVSGTHYASSDILELFGTVLGQDVDPINPLPLIDVGDFVETPSGNSEILSLTDSSLTLTSPLNTFQGQVTLKSRLSYLGKNLDDAVQVFMPFWFGSKFSKNLDAVDRAITVLMGKATPATRGEASIVLGELKTLLQMLNAILSSNQIPSTTGTEERAVVDGIVATLTERRYDRALSFLLKLQVQEFFELTGETASFGGNAMRSMSELATLDLEFPNTQLDEGSGFKGQVEEPET